MASKQNTFNLKVIENKGTVRKKTGSPRTLARKRADNEFHKAFKVYESRGYDADEFQNFYSTGVGGNVEIEPPFNITTLIKLPEINNILQQCIEAMVTNTVLNGYEIVPANGIDRSELESEEAEREYKDLEGFLSQVNEDQDITELLENFQYDYEATGNSYIEKVVQNGKPMALYHIQAHTVRLTGQDENPTTVNKSFIRNGEKVILPRKHYFRRYTQRNSFGASVYFKEYGDPRVISSRDGNVIDVSELLNDSENQNAYLANGKQTRHAEAAHFLLHRKRYSPNELYGMPRYFNQLPSILGSREAELTNLDYFKSNAIPAMVVMVAGGMLTEESYEAVVDVIESVRGRDAQNKVLILEASGDEETFTEDGKSPIPKLDFRTMVNDRQLDALFQEYDKNAAEKVRSSFRLPHIFLGATSDYSESTAKSSLIVAENQVFAPEKRKIEDFVNTKILDGFRLKYWKFQLKPARFVSAEDVVTGISKLDEMGAITPNTAIGILNELYKMSVPFIDKPWANYPFAISRLLANQGMLAGVEDILATPPRKDPSEPDFFDPNDPNIVKPEDLQNANNEVRDIRDNDNNVGTSGAKEVGVEPSNNSQRQLEI